MRKEKFCSQLKDTWYVGARERGLSGCVEVSWRDENMQDLIKLDEGDTGFSFLYF
jgi:hypothetical protein